MKIINLFLFFISLIIINSNLWDNIFSQSKSPHLSISYNFQLLLLNEKDNSTLGELLMSSEHNLTKFSFILDDSNKKDSFIQLLVNFTNGKIFFDIEEQCYFKYYSLIEQISPKFILNAYDVLSYFSEDEDNFHYIVINPLELTVVENDKLSQIPKILKNVLHNVEKSIYKSKTIFDRAYYADFIVDKKNETIREISIKIGNTFNNFNTVYKPYNVEKEKFNSIHNLKDCIEYEE